MYIIDRNQAERAQNSDFSDEMLSRDLARRALAVLIPMAFFGTLLVLWALFAGASPLALMVAFVFGVALFSGRKK